MKKLSSAKRIQVLSLRNTKITDMGLKTLKGLQSLESLDLRESKITDAGLRFVAILPSLRKIDLDNTGVSHEGIVSFQSKMPKCKIASRPVPGARPWR